MTIVACSLKYREDFPQITIETIEITTSLSRLRAASIHTIPAVKIDSDVLTGLILTRGKIRTFIRKHLR